MSEHHAYLLRAESDNREDQEFLIGQLAIAEIHRFESDTILIDDARRIIRRACLCPAQGERQLILISANSIRVEAQQALLKTLEEPSATTVFLLSMPTSANLLPTLLSRLYEYEGSKQASVDTKLNSEFADFCALDHKGRFEEITKRLEKQDTVWVENIRKGLSEKITKQPLILTGTALRSLCMIVENLNTRGASNKMLLEEMAISFPISK